MAEHDNIPKLDNIPESDLDQDMMQQPERTCSIVGEEMTYRLPPEVWEHIFRYLETPNDLLSVRTVCRYWKSIIDGCPSLITRMTLSFPFLILHDQYVPVDLFPAFSVKFISATIRSIGSWWPSVGQRLTYLHLQNSSVKLPALIAMLRETPNLRQFSMISADVDSRDDSEIDFRLDKLEHLQLLDMFMAHDSNLLTVLQRICSRLKVFHLDNSGYEEQIVELIRGTQETLEVIELGSFNHKIILKELTVMERLHLKKVILWSLVDDQQELVDFCRMQPTIEFLEVKQLEEKYLEEQQVVNNSTLCAIGEALPVLRHINVKIRAKVDPTFLNSMSGLEHLSLSNDERWMTASIDLGPYKMPNLKELYMNGFKLEGLRQFFDVSLNIRKLSLHGCGLNNWSDIFGTLKNLHELELHSTTSTEDDDEFGITGLVNLRYLSCVSSYSLKCKRLFMALCPLCPHLERICLLGTIFDDEITLVLCREVHQLKRLTFTECAISDTSMKYIRTYCRALREIHIKYCPRVTNVGVASLSSMENIKVIWE